MATATKSLVRDSDRSVRLAAVLKAMGHPIRLRIIAALAVGEEHVNALAELLDTPQPVISQHLQVLRMGGLVETTRENGFAFYRLAEPKLRKIIDCMEQCHNF